MPSKSPLIKVLVLFVTGIILPTGFLVYLGIISIKSETLLLQKESEERVGKTSQAIADNAQAVIHDIFAALSQVVKKNALNEYKASNDSVSTLVLVDSNDHLLYPIQEFHRRPIVPMPALPPDIRQDLTSAEAAEFRKHDYALAILKYRSLAEDVEFPRWKAIFLNSVAGCLVKMEQYDAAESQYQEILSRYSQDKDQGAQPFGVVIALQLGELQEKRGRPDLAIAGYIKVFQELYSSRWDLSWDELQFFVRRLNKRMQSHHGRLTDADQYRWQDLQTQYDHVSKAAAQATDFMNLRWPALKRTLREQNRSGEPFLIFEDRSARRVVAYVPLYDSLRGTLDSALVVEMGSNSLIDRLKQTINRLSTASNLAFRLDTANGDLLGQSVQQPEGKRWPIERWLKQSYPALRVSISSVSDIPVERAAARRRQVYIGMVVLAAIVILIALYTTWYAVSREIEVAELKSRFVASMSHELKTPLSIIGFIGQKLQFGRYRSQAEIKDYYSMISEETARLKSLIDEVLDFSRLMENRQPYRKVPIDLVALVRETVRRFMLGSTSNRVHLDCVCEPASCVASVDHEALSRVLLNLLDNAVKYSPPDRIRITLRLKQSGDEAVIEVADEGFGISPEEKELVFDRFYRGKSSSDYQHTKGVGLGLSIVQHIVTAHHGRIDLQSTVGKGSVFTVRIPVSGNSGL